MDSSPLLVVPTECIAIAASGYDVVNCMQVSKESVRENVLSLYHGLGDRKVLRILARARI